MRKKTLLILEQFFLVLWLGGTYTLSLLALPKAFAVLPKTFAGKYVAAIFPSYFLGSALCLGALLLLHALQKPWKGKLKKALTVLYLICGLSLAINLAVALPRSLQAKEQMATAESAKIRDQKQEKFRLYHGLSMAANGIIMLCGIPILVLLRIKE